MNWKTTRALSAALLMGTAALVMTGLVPQQPAYAATTENKALVDTISGMNADAKAGRYADALAKAKAADAMPGKPAGMAQTIHKAIVAYAIQAKDYASALAQIDKMVAANEGDKNANLKQALSVSIQMKNKQKTAEYQEQLGNNLDPETRLYIAGTMADAGQYREALVEAAPLLQANPPLEKALQFKQAINGKMNDIPGRRDALEQLTMYYPKPDYWHDLLQLARNEKGLNDEMGLDVTRLRLLVGDLKTDTDYQEMAQLALVAEYPNEAKAILDKANAAKLLNGERAARLIKMTNDRVTANAAAMTDLQKRAAADPNASVKLGLVYWTYGKHKEAEEAIRAGMKGKLADPDMAKVALGQALLSQGKKAEAIAAFNSVPKNSKASSVARLWSIYSRNAKV
jgi:hypothetical protein